MAPIIPARWPRAWRASLLGLLAALVLSAQSLETLSTAYRKTPNVRTRAAVRHFAELHPTDKNGALALLTLGATELDERQFGDALHHLKAAAPRLPELADYVSYLSAEAESGLQAYAETEDLLNPVWHSSPASPLVGRAVTLQAGSYMQTSQPAKAVSLVSEHRADLPDTQTELLLARAYDAAGDTAGAAAQFQKLYVEHPLSKEASDAQSALARYPALGVQVLLQRGENLVDGGDYARAVKEFSALLPQLSGRDLELARLKIGVARYLARDTRLAFQELTALQASAPELDAERIYYVAQCQRRLDHIDDMKAMLDKLGTTYPQSHWYLQGLISTANYYSAHNQPDAAEALNRTCYTAFPNDSQSAQCHWKAAWAEYLRDPARAEPMLREHVTRYPQSDRISTALYFLGRVAESRADLSGARAFYEAIVTWYPNFYYATLARERLDLPVISGASRSAEAGQFLATLRIPPTKIDGFEATPATKRRLDRARLLASAALDDFAEGELRFGARTDAQPQVIAMELAELAGRRAAPDQGIRFIKRYAPTYLSLPMASAPPKFWQLAFPMPYRKELEEYCQSLSLDPYLVAALIRQESEFNPKAVSRANARGLTQVMPSTGRQVSRQLKLRGYTTSKLFVPDTNLKIGTYYLKALSDQLQGKWEATLASYNAGKSRVVTWLSATNYHEPAEFVESIPFNETRVYVESVLRNAEVYRRLYGQKAR